MKNYKFLISGQVQGVWYRRSVQQNARAKGFNGYVKNLDDGRVEAAVSCDETRREVFVALLYEGSPLSHVEHIHQSETPEIFGNGFVVT